MLEEVWAPTGSGDPGGFYSQSESKEGGGKGKQREKGTFRQWMLDVARSSKLSHSVGAGVKWNALQLCCLDTIWIFQLPVCLFAVNKVLCFIKCVPVIFPPKLTTATVIMLLVKNCAELCTAAFVNKQRTCLKEKVVHLFVLLYIIVILFRRHKSPWKDLSRRHVIKAAVFYFSFFFKTTISQMELNDPLLCNL